MSDWPNYPAVYEINTWVWLDELSRKIGRTVSLGDVPRAELERLAGYGFDALWLMGAWQRSTCARRIAREHPGLQTEYGRALPDYSLDDVVGSPYAVYAYDVDPALGGNQGLAIFRERLEELGLSLILDFVPNHLAVDHPWVSQHPERFVQGSPESLAKEPWNFFSQNDGQGETIFAHGRDPNFRGWTDSVQLDYRRADTREAMSGVLLGIAKRCDGVRCDMAMLVTRDVFCRTWGGEFDSPGAEFWIDAIGRVMEVHRGFLMLAEVYWDMEYRLQRLGFDYTYDKRLYDRLLTGDAPSIQAHLRADMEYQRHLARFIENHDEKRAAAVFGPQRSRSMATLAAALPGLRLVHEGQIEGRRLKLPVQLGRRRPEAPEPGMEVFYRRLIKALAHPIFHEGQWQLLEPKEAWQGNPGFRSFIAYRWVLGEEQRLVTVNLAHHQAQCYIPLDMPAPAGRSWRFHDLLGEAEYVREGEDLSSRGLYLDMPEHGYHLFALTFAE